MHTVPHPGHPQRHAQNSSPRSSPEACAEFLTQVILDPVKITAEIRHHTLSKNEVAGCCVTFPGRYEQIPVYLRWVRTNDKP